MMALIRQGISIVLRGLLLLILGGACGAFLAMLGPKPSPQSWSKVENAMKKAEQKIINEVRQSGIIPIHLVSESFRPLQLDEGATPASPLPEPIFPLDPYEETTRIFHMPVIVMCKASVSGNVVLSAQTTGRYSDRVNYTLYREFDVSKWLSKRK